MVPRIGTQEIYHKSEPEKPKLHVHSKKNRLPCNGESDNEKIVDLAVSHPPPLSSPHKRLRQTVLCEEIVYGNDLLDLTTMLALNQTKGGNQCQMNRLFGRQTLFEHFYAIKHLSAFKSHAIGKI